MTVYRSRRVVLGFSFPRIRHEIGLYVTADFDPAIRPRPCDTEQDVSALLELAFQSSWRSCVFDFPLDHSAGARRTRAGSTAKGEADSGPFRGIENRLILGSVDGFRSPITPPEFDSMAIPHCHTSLVQSPSGHLISCARAGPFGISPKSTRKSSSNVIVPFRGFTSALSITEPRSASSG